MRHKYDLFGKFVEHILGAHLHSLHKYIKHTEGTCRQNTRAHANANDCIDLFILKEKINAQNKKNIAHLNVAHSLFALECRLKRER